ncbi:MAG: hypothetical protein ABIZ81_06860 [Opitutaceae bacterium]
MTTLLKIWLRYLGFLAASLASAGTPPEEMAGAVAPVEHTTEQKALLKALDDQLTQFEALLTKDENLSHAATVKANLATLKQRRDAFKRVTFDSGKYDELRFDLNVAYQRLHLWLAPSVPSKTAPKESAQSSKTR